MNRVKHFLKEELWRIDVSRRPKAQGHLINLLKISLITGYDFFKDRCHVLASSLTYYSLIAMVPFSAVVFVALKEAGVQNTYGISLLNHILINPEISESIIDYVNRTDVSALGVIGVLALLKIASFLLSHIERYFNEIWGIKEKRPLLKRAFYYIIAIIILPVILTVGLSAAIDFIGTHVPVARGFFPYLIAFSGFTLLYFAFPNVRVKLSAALTAGVVTGLLWLSAQRIYVLWSSRATELNIIYGSFSQLVLLFIWIYVSWMIILAGAELSFAVQNFRVYKSAGNAGAVSFSSREKLALMAAASVFRRSSDNGTPVPAEDVIEDVGGPVKLVNELLYELAETGMLVESYKNKQRFFRPRPGREDASAWDIIGAVRGYGKSDLEVNDNEISDNVDKLLSGVNRFTRERFRHISVRDI